MYNNEPTNLSPRRKYETGVINAQFFLQFLEEKENRGKSNLVYFLDQPEKGGRTHIAAEIFFDSDDQFASAAEFISDYLCTLDRKLRSRNATVAAYDFSVLAAGDLSTIHTGIKGEDMIFSYWSSGRIYTAPVLVFQGDTSDLEKISKGLSRHRTDFT